MRIIWDKKNSVFKKSIISLVIFICFLIFLYFGTITVSKSSRNETKQTLENAVRRAVIQCYAIEGMYPPNIEYLENHYGLIIDHNNYVVHYEAFASNILPDISVISLYD